MEKHKVWDLPLGDKLTVGRLKKVLSKIPEDALVFLMHMGGGRDSIHIVKAGQNKCNEEGFVEAEYCIVREGDDN